MTYNLETVLQALATGSPLVAIVFAVVTWLGNAGLKGKALLYTGAAIGIAVGAGYLISELGMPVNFTGWFYLVLYSLVIGFTPSGIYETGKKIAVKAVENSGR